ncbi:Crp/Fnr family transcriptional regulator [Paenibacillus sp. IHBB 10380]|jgi:CRP/FNR family transcriptional regulator|uniref:Crp/Fnr family transcriptional regulator n=1 Tax=Paenibacillus sp. IHBB 10380 TaxID=1566358 RepID=UPI0005CFA95A|nr:Crp/Fnr family transcriptional regulator [Paenibacillus sp. IHBB 10380]AJS60599.1 cAMP-binding protein [Paenibacillus sp. IHBB 10380]
MINNISEITIFSDIPEDELQHITPLLKERHFKKNHILMFENDESEEVYLLRSGMVKIYRMYEGKEVVLSIMIAGDITGEVEALSSDNHRISSIEALENVSVWQMSKQDFLHIVDKYPSVLRNAYKILVERTRMLNRMIRYLTFYDVRGKVANLIMDLYYNFGTNNDNVYKIDLKINQSLLANMLGVTRESISKTLGDFQDEGLIDIRDKHFYLLDMDLLESICNETEEFPTLRKWYNS